MLTHLQQRTWRKPWFVCLFFFNLQLVFSVLNSVPLCHSQNASFQLVCFSNFWSCVFINLKKENFYLNFLLQNYHACQHILPKHAHWSLARLYKQAQYFLTQHINITDFRKLGKSLQITRSICCYVSRFVLLSAKNRFCYDHFLTILLSSQFRQ